MGGLANLIVERSADFWRTKTALVVALLIAVPGLLYFFVSHDLEKIALNEWVILGICVLAIVGLWFCGRRIPRSSKDKVGFGVAIEFEDPTQQTSVTSDLISRLRTLLSEHQSTYPFELIVFPVHICKSLERDAAVKLMNKSRCMFLIFGLARVREHDGHQLHVFDLSGIVRHKPIADKSMAKKFESEFTAVLPKRLNVGKNGDFFAFEFTAKWFDIVTRYIVGVAAFYTLEFQYAESLLCELEADLHKLEETEFPAIKLIKQWIPVRLREIYACMSDACYHKYFMERHRSSLVELETIAGKVQARWPNDPAAHHRKAMTEFMLHRNLESARAEINACPDVEDNTKLLSLAFLDAYEGKLEEAYRTYRRAFDMPTANLTIPLQVEEFIQIVLNEEPEKEHLYFCTGMVNHRMKCDLRAAKSDFIRFQQNTEEESYPRQHEAVKKWIREIDGQLID